MSNMMLQTYVNYKRVQVSFDVPLSYVGFATFLRTVRYVISAFVSHDSLSQ